MTAIFPTSAPAGAAGASIRVFLADGTPDGLRLVEKSNWTGLGIVCPRSQYPDARQRGEFARPGIYVLVGPGDAALPQVYIGEAEELRGRLDNHYQNKDFWTRVVAFTSKDGNVNKAHVRYLESRLVALANAAKRAELANGTAPALPALSEPDTADVENFLREMLLIFPILEVTAFQVSGAPAHAPSPQASPDLVEASLHLAGPQTDATGVDTAQGFLVKAGSRGRAQEVPSMHEWLRNIRKSLIGQGILAIDGDHLFLTQDYAFDSPSSAAGVLLGRAANGRTEWKDAHGNTLKQLQIAALEQPIAQALDSTS
jgi:Domain of unknown function (DUF4357)